MQALLADTPCKAASVRQHHCDGFGITWWAVQGRGYLCQPEHVVAVVVHIDDVSLLHVCGHVFAASDGLPQVPWARVLRQGVGQPLLRLEFGRIQEVGDAVPRVQLDVLCARKLMLFMQDLTVRGAQVCRVW